MKRSEKLLDAIGQIDDKLVAEAAQAGRTSGSRTKNKKKKKLAKIYRWQGALAACAVLAVCVGVIGLLSRSGMLLGPAGADSSGAEEMAMDDSAQDAAAGSADISAQSAEAAAESSEATSRQASAPDMAEAAPEDGNTDQEMKEAGQNVQSAGSAADGSAAGEEDGGISAQSADQESTEQSQQQKNGGSAEATEKEQTDACSLPPVGESVAQSEELAAVMAPALFTIKESDEKGVTFLIKNEGEQEIYFGKAFELERFVNETWEMVVPEKEIVWNEVDISVGAGDTYEETIVLDSYYGALQPGRYRIVKTCQLAAGKEPEGQETYPMYAEFTIGQ